MWLIFVYFHNVKRHFIEEDTQMENKHMKRCSISSAIKETRIKTTMSYHYKPIRTAKMKVSHNSKCL